MNTTTIAKLLGSRCKGQFFGVFSSDNLPTRIKKLPMLLICNTDPSDRGGEHWLAIYIDSNRCGEFFDSFGREPGRPFSDFMNKHCVHWIYNDKQLQNVLSTYCGHYCVLYCLYKSRGFSMSRIVGMFTDDTSVNDRIVARFVKYQIK
jgi:hypothetical protein